MCIRLLNKKSGYKKLELSPQIIGFVYSPLPDRSSLGHEQSADVSSSVVASGLGHEHISSTTLALSQRHVRDAAYARAMFGQLVYETFPLVCSTAQSGCCCCSSDDTQVIEKSLSIGRPQNDKDTAAQWCTRLKQ